MQLTVLGAYLPHLTPERLATWIAQDVQSFKIDIRELKTRGLAQAWSEEEVDLRAAELAEELEEELGAAALFEVLVENHADEFDPFAISEKHTASVAWEPVYLSADGNRSIAEHPSELAGVKNFRVAFFVHEWPEGGELVGLTGPLAHPPFTAMPERLWRLAPYALID